VRESTAGVLELCRLAEERHGLRSVRAAVADLNPGSVRVLVKAGFRVVGPANPEHLGGKTGRWFVRETTKAHEGQQGGTGSSTAGR